MQRSDFSYSLPDELIARYPATERSASRLLELDGDDGSVRHRRFVDLLESLQSGDLLVFNNTRVIPARLYGEKASGGKVEILIERLQTDNMALAHIRASKSPKPGAFISLYDREGGPTEHRVQVTGRSGDLFELHFDSSSSSLEILQQLGHVPLPPYIDRADESADMERYQTVYAQVPGAVAAPTAGLHFDEPLLKALADKGVRSAYVTLHVGAGTFQPVRADDIRDHTMHAEWVEVDEGLCRAVAETRAAGGRVIAVGTTSVRCLESASANGDLQAYSGDTDIFIYPGYRFRCIDGLITNFHLPESTLLMLVSAFAGRENILASYAAAVDERYRFFSYGDAMLIWPQASARVGQS